MFLARLVGLLLATAQVGAFASTSPLQVATRSSPLSIPQQHDFARLDGNNPLPNLRRQSSSSVGLALSFPRGGAAAAAASETVLSKLSNWNKTPSSLFNTSLIALALITTIFKVSQRDPESAANAEKKPDSIVSLQRRFLAVFWLLRCADWLQGPYFYEVYASKMFNGVQASMSLVSRLFLTGFASTALFGPLVGRATDNYGRKKGTLAFSIIYALGAISTKSPILKVLFLGRVLSGIGTSLLFSAPESWLVGEAQKSGDDPDGKYLGETFGLAYAGDSIVAILAGQFAGFAAANRGSTGPFELSTCFLLFGGLLAALLWKENVAESSGGNEKPSIREAVDVVKSDPKIMLVGAVQSLFEAAMYIFVLQWPPAISKAVGKAFGSGSATPYGTVFSCFMASCLLGSTLFGQLAKMGVATETSTSSMLSVATVAMTAGTLIVSASSATISMSLAGLMAAFFAFEACVGMYFPSIGTLRSKYVPDSHRSVIMNLFGIPLNLLVVSVFLSTNKLGLKGALSVSSAALGVAALCMLKLKSIAASEKA